VRNDTQNIKKTQSIVGFGRNRDPFDNYPTPDYAIIELLKREKFEGSVWEPACGKGNIAKFFPECIATDIRKDDIYGQGNVDFFAVNRKVDNIITNPPYSLAKEFVEHSLQCANKKTAMLLKLSFLESESRHNLFLKTPLKTVYAFSKRLTLAKESDTRKHSGMIAFAWFVWDKEYTGKPALDWILAEPSPIHKIESLQMSRNIVETEYDEMIKCFA
jgi:hypothetical protein